MKHTITIFASLILLIMSQLNLAETTRFGLDNFDKQLQANKSTLVAVHAPWCSTCRAQAAVLKDVLSQKEFKNIAVLYVDFDSQKELLKKLNVKRQSTLVVFKEGKEMGRSLGDTTIIGVEELLQKVL